MPSVVACDCNPSAGKADTADLWGLPANLDKYEISGPIKINKVVGTWGTHVGTHTLTYTQNAQRYAFDVCSEARYGGMSL